jgi:AcrR family transcriptional regulator
MRPADVAAAKALMKEGSLPVRDIARRLNVSVATLYRYAGKRGQPADGVEPDRLRA